MLAGCPEGLLLDGRDTVADCLLPEDVTDDLEDDDGRDALDDERDALDDERDELDEERDELDEVRDTDEERDEDDEREPPRDCASDSGLKAANANPISIAANVLADNLMIKKFKVNICGTFATVCGKTPRLFANNP